MSNDEFPLPGEVGEQFLRLRQGAQKHRLSRQSERQGHRNRSVRGFHRCLSAHRPGTITDIKVFPHGCVYTLVCASAMSELAKGRDLDQALELEPARGGGGPRRSAGRPPALCPSGGQYPGRGHRRLLQECCKLWSKKSEPDGAGLLRMSNSALIAGRKAVVPVSRISLECPG